MWYFAWMLGLPLAAVFAVMNAMWLELQRDRKLAEEGDGALVSAAQPDHK
ncbi:cytochrome bd-I oxidase subunit CydX [Epibacterium sp. SM1969]|uniref:Cytochrome bd-I oxidase subunit CydX n=1 Tax=Tritonibacter aquimaris TaxID=2663379 RepID=A0A844ALL3_9RHOB|nr:cytochrome bd-I oxidase subunit CydX [Tritonibacter aquimaris]MQY42569.1 cytochrome bd-I oxidase subunit CydX [Tritonibacter aquimaris]